jgi:tRNA A-37 threonylcarbamoyl transferase component Bud32
MLGKYVVLRPLARGGMAELLLARTDGPHGFEKLVALKRIRPELADDEQFVKMFLDEARLAATLHHPNVVQVFDIGEEAGAYFLAMEYLEGEDVRSLMHALRSQHRRLALDEALAIGIGVCAGLHYAHDRVGGDGRPLEIVHRDVSPQNVVVTWDGGVKVVDFGIARAARRATETRQGTLKGKVEYMSPEQCRGEAIDRRADVFAIGILLWELTTGRRLFAGASDYEVLKAIVERPPPRPSVVVEDYPRELEEIVLKALAREPEARWATAQLLQRALEGFARERRLDLSPVRLGACVRELFADDLAAWNEARTLGGDALERYAETRAARVHAEATSTDVDDTASTVDRPRTRAVGAAPRRRTRTAPLLIAAGAITLLAAAGAATWLNHTPKHRNANANANVNAAGDKPPPDEIRPLPPAALPPPAEVVPARAAVEHPTAHTRETRPTAHHSHVTRPTSPHPPPSTSRASTPAPPLRPPPPPAQRPPRRAADLDAPLPPSP